MNIIATISFLAAAVLAVEVYDMKTEKDNLSHNLTIDKKAHNNEISEILVRYDAVLKQNQQLTQEIGKLQNKSLKISDSVKDNYQSSLNILKDNLSTLAKEGQNKSAQLETLNTILRLKQQDFENNKKEIEKLNAKISQLESEIMASSDSKTEKKRLKASNVSAVGARIVSEKILETRKTKHTEQIKVCFMLEENAAIEKGAKEIFIQIINPNANIVSKNKTSVEIKNQTLFYSAKTKVNYEKEDVNVCVFIDMGKQHLVKGNYAVNIFSGANLIGNSNLLLL